MSFHDETKKQPRRLFCKEALTLVLGGVSLLVPAGAGLSVFLDPLWRKTGGVSVRVAGWGDLPEDGSPRRFPVLADRTDAWNRYPQSAVGVVYLRRAGEKKVEALNAICPHAGGLIDFLPARKCFVCPIHNSQFTPDGALAGSGSPSPRAMDSLPVELRGDDIWVTFHNFQSGVRGKIPV